MCRCEIGSNFKGSAIELNGIVDAAIGEGIVGKVCHSRGILVIKLHGFSKRG